MGKTSTWLAGCCAFAVLAGCARVPIAEDDSATPSRLFPFCEEGKWGYMNRKGEVVVPPHLARAGDFRDGLARVHSEKDVAYLDEQGKIAFMIPADWATRRFSEGLAAFRAGDKYGFFDREGKVVVERKFDDVWKFSEGLAAVNIGAKSQGFPRPFVKEGGKWGFIDKTGQLVIPVQFDSVDERGFSDGLALVTVGYIDKSGKVIIRPEEKSDDPNRMMWGAGGFSEGLARVCSSSRMDSLTGFIDRTGKVAIKPQFHQARDFSEGLAAVATDRGWGYVDRHGSVAIKPQFEKADDFSEGLAAVKGGHWSYIDKQGKVVITGQFNDAEAFTGGLARVHEGGSFEITHDGPAYWSGGAWFYINRKGEKVRRCCQDSESPGYGREQR